jgi:hypothetical protein
MCRLMYLLWRINLFPLFLKEELTKDYYKFHVKIIQLYYDDEYDKYEKMKEEDITETVTV